MNFILKIKEYLSSHPNSTVYSAIICSVTAMSTADLTSLLGAIGLFLSTIIGLTIKTITELGKWSQDKADREQKRKIAMMKAESELKRTEIDLLKAKSEITNQ